jgi:hypothetical protein
MSSFGRRVLPAGKWTVDHTVDERNRAATVPARSAHAFLAHPTRFERVTLAFRALLLALPALG